MVTPVVLDKEYIGLVYKSEVRAIADTATTYIPVRGGTSNQKVADVVKNLVKVSEILISSMAAALKEDRNFCRVRITHYKQSEGKYKVFEDTLRRIFDIQFDVTVGVSDAYVRTSEGQVIEPTFLEANIPIQWNYTKGNELRLELGLPLVGEPDAENKRQKNEWRKSGHLTDYTFKVQKTEFSVHKVVLAAYSKYFESLFSTNFRDGNAKEAVKFGEDDLQPEVFEAFLTFIYTGTVELSQADVGFLLQLINLATMAFDAKLQRICALKLQTLIDNEHFFAIALLAIHSDNTRLRAVCRAHLAKNFEKISEALDFPTLTAKMLVDIYSVSQIFECEPLKANVCQALFKITRENFGALCEAVNSGAPGCLQERFKPAAYGFVQANKKLVESEEMQGPREAYTALMTGLDRPSKRQKQEM